MRTIEGKTAEDWFDAGLAAKSPQEKIRAYSNAIQLNPEDASEPNDKLQTPTMLSDDERRRSSVKDNMGFSMLFNALNESAISERNEADSKSKDTQPSMVTTPLRDTAIDGYGDSIL